MDNKGVKKRKRKSSKLTKNEKLALKKKNCSILGIGEMGIKGLYKLSELNFTSYNTFKVETRAEFKEFNDDYESHKLDIKKSKVIVIMGDYEDVDTIGAIRKIAKECKTKTNLICLVGDIKYKGMFENMVDTTLYFDKNKIKQLGNLEMSECLGVLTTCILTPTISEGLITLDLNELIIILRNKKSYYFGYSKGLNNDIKTICENCFETVDYVEDYENILINFWSNNTLSVLNVFEIVNDLETKYPSKTIISSYTKDIENNKEVEINIIIG